ncbi:MAG: CBS domain-containing protein [Candidatus Aenigmarchaeota archaeon]|nr:CBS domain-containing protein [Candidatus Aenigmarchaeota archaeon]
MLPEIGEIKRRRMRLGLKQLELARASNVSQSLVAKIESGKLNPSYEIAKRIFAALDHHERGEEKKAKDIMAEKLIFARKTDTVKDITTTMKKHGISQLPVLDKNAIIGSISEKAIMDHIGNGGDVSSLSVGKIMEEPFPTVGESAPVSMLKSLLTHSQAVVVMKNSRPEGIITKSDLLKMAR